VPGAPRSPSRTIEPLTDSLPDLTVWSMASLVPDPVSPVSDACAEARQEAAQRCDAARAASQRHAAGAERTRLLRRDLVAAQHRLSAAETAAAPEARRAEKDQARQQYLTAREAATTDGERNQATAEWAQALDRINRASRLAGRAVAKARTATQGLDAAIREAERTEQTLRIHAEAAEAACLDARVRLAGCEERWLGGASPIAAPVAGAPMPVPGGPVPAVGGPMPAVGGPMPLRAVPLADPGTPLAGASRTAGSSGAAPLMAAPPTRGSPMIARPPISGPPMSAPTTNPPAGWTTPQGGPGPGQARVRVEPHADPLVIESMVTGDRVALELAAAAVAEHGRLAPAEIRAQLQELVDAVESAASEAGYLVFDPQHPFWAQLSVGEAADVVSGLARLGFRFEPAEGWHAGRAPAPADLSMALAYAGLDTRMRRSMPSAQDLRVLPLSVGVDSRSWLAANAPDLAMDQLVRLLDARAATLGPLWDAWGLVRPVLLSSRHQLGSLPG
jgi:hypothetical protein